MVTDCIPTVALYEDDAHLPPLAPKRKKDKYDSAQDAVLYSNIQHLESTQVMVADLPALARRIKDNRLTLSNEYKVYLLHLTHDSNINE